MMSPILSPASLPIRLRISNLAFSRRLGLMSSDFMLSETSSAMKMSTPSCFTSSSLVPIRGLASATRRHATAASRTTNFASRLLRLASPDRRSSIRGFPNRPAAFALKRANSQYTRTITGMTASAYRYSILANRIMSRELPQERAVQSKFDEERDAPGQRPAVKQLCVRPVRLDLYAGLFEPVDLRVHLFERPVVRRAEVLAVRDIRNLLQRLFIHI